MAKKFKKNVTINVPIEIAYKFLQQMFGDMIKSKNEYLSLKRFKYSEIDGEINKRYIFQSKCLFTRVLIDCEFARLSDKKTKIIITYQIPWSPLRKLLVEAGFLQIISYLKSLENMYLIIKDYELKQKL